MVHSARGSSGGMSYHCRPVECVNRLLLVRGKRACNVILKNLWEKKPRRRWRQRSKDLTISLLWIGRTGLERGYQ